MWISSFDPMGPAVAALLFMLGFASAKLDVASALHVALPSWGEAAPAYASLAATLAFFALCVAWPANLAARSEYEASLRVLGGRGGEAALRGGAASDM